jgi:hypothetical protein
LFLATNETGLLFLRRPEVLAGRSTVGKKKLPEARTGALPSDRCPITLEYLAKHGGIRPRKPESMDVAIHSADIAA